MRYTCYNPKYDNRDVKFELGIKFEGPNQFKEAVQRYAIVNRYDIK